MQDANQLKIKATPVFYANRKAYEAGYKVICNEGGSRCFAAGTMVHTESGLKAIERIEAGERVHTPDGLKAVVNVYENENTGKAVRIVFKNGRELICTPNHRFKHKGQWVEISEILKTINHEASTKF
jgi:intein/homing endonuclease